MTINQYDSLVTELTSFIQKYKELEKVNKDAEFDLKWRLTELFKSVEQSDEQKFIDISGMKGHLTTTAEKKELSKIKKEVAPKDYKSRELSSMLEINKKNVDKAWAKSLYKRSVRRCHPDTLKVPDSDYKEELIQLYKSITESYENCDLDILMVESYKLFIKPKEVISDQIEILKNSKNLYHKKIKNILASQAYAWSTFDDAMKEVFLINLMKQHGVRFIDKEKVKDIIKRKVSNRKPGERPKKKLCRFVKNKK